MNAVSLTGRPLAQRLAERAPREEATTTNSPLCPNCATECPEFFCDLCGRQIPLKGDH